VPCCELDRQHQICIRTDSPTLLETAPSAFRTPASKPQVSKPVPPPGVTERRVRLRRLEDSLVRELALKGWSSGMAATELDLDHSLLWRHSRRLAVTWTRHGARSFRGEPAPGIKELRRLRARASRDRGCRPG
jgi:hypothetical protein